MDSVPLVRLVEVERAVFITEMLLGGFFAAEFVEGQR